MRVEVSGLEVLQRADRALRQAIDDALGRGALEIADEARRTAPVAFSLLQQSIRPLRADWNHWQVVAGVNYARQVEQGRRPGGPLPDPRSIEAWMKTKRITPHAQGMPIKTAAFLIARHIRDFGSPAQPFLAPALESKRSRVEALVLGALRKVGG
ncbi:MAG TPA: hypothetical protein DIC36_00930 [Gammaproteobacteria bacterium]|nr:hypothetical protein [Gammaproteobacteria bacterium]